jgi:predicted ferric reductase
MRNLSLKATLWVVVYFVLVLAPVLLLFPQPRPEGREFWREVSVALGFVGLSLMGLQFVPTARLPFLASVFPLDTLYSFHHRVSITSFALILAHPLILFIYNPFTIRLLNLLDAPLRARAGTLALLGLAVLVGTSVWRLGLRLSYEAWRIAHSALAIAIAALALYHILNVNWHTSVPRQRYFWIAWAVIWGGMVLYVRVIKPWMMLRRPWRVREVRPERGASWTLALEPDGHEGFRFKPGQVAWLTIGRSPFGIREHPFSLTSSALESDHITFTIRELGDFTSTVGDIRPGVRAYVDGPYGTFDIDQHTGPGYVFIAGGIGAAPIMSMLRTMADRGDDRAITFFYGNRTWDSISFREELVELEARLNLTVVHLLEEPPEGWEGETGFITREMLDRHLPADRHERVYFVCGPIPMIAVVERALRALGVPLTQIHSERYEMA